jgi:dolichol-phosphate mannosyltransferase
VTRAVEFIKAIAVIPTYNEAQNIIPLTGEVLAQDPRIEVLVVDDDSPDGTWQLVEEMRVMNGRVHLLRRRSRKGRGLAGIDGFLEALRLGAEVVLEMDGDYSHHPREIPNFLRAILRAHVVVGSRFLPGGEDLRGSPLRTMVSRCAAAYIRWMLGVSVSDPTSGYRCFRREVLDGIDLRSLRSKGPSVVEEVLWRCHRRGYSIVEIPIRFEPRRAGSSKLSFLKLMETAIMVAWLRTKGPASMGTA